MLFTCIKSWFFRNHLANFHQISHWSYCWNVIDSLFKWLCSINCQAHIFFFKTKNCSNDDLFIGCDDRIGKMLHNICISAVVMSHRWASCGPWASCLEFPLNLKFWDADLSGLVGCKSDWWSGDCEFQYRRVGNILMLRLTMKYFLPSFSPIC